MFSAQNSRELRAMVLAMKAANRSMKSEITKRMRETMNPVWKSAVASNITWGMETRMLNPGTLIKAGNPPMLQAAASKRPTTKGKRLVPDRDWPGYEYGGDPGKYSRYERKNRTTGGYHVVKRRTQAHLRRRKAGGYVIGPAVAETAPRLVALAVQSVVQIYMKILDPK